jgi:hypothetical protein
MKNKKLDPTPTRPNSVAYVYYFFPRSQSGTKYRRWYYITRERGNAVGPSKMVPTFQAVIDLAASEGFTRIHTPYGNLRRHG